MSSPGNGSCDLQHLHTLRLQSRAAHCATLAQLNDLRDCQALAARSNLTLLPLGQGSNIVPREHVDAMVLRVAMRGIAVLAEDANSVLVEVAAGENWHEFVDTCVDRGWHGLENLALIPGLVGAAPIQNIGAYGVEVASAIESVRLIPLQNDSFEAAAGARGWQPDGAGVYTLAGEQCGFSYRDSIFKQALKGRCLIVAVRLRLAKRFTPVLDYPALATQFAPSPGHPANARPTARELFDAVVEIRSSKLPDPAVIPNAGSFFKNPVIDAQKARELQSRFEGIPVFDIPGQPGQCKLAAGWLIEQCGFRGRKTGKVGMYDRQALVLVNHSPGETGATDVLAFAKSVRAAVEDKFAVVLEQEPELFG